VTDSILEVLFAESNRHAAESVGGYDETAFADWGIAIERLAPPRRRSRDYPDQRLPRGLLRDLDRFLALECHTPGSIAIHADGEGKSGGNSGAGWLGAGGEALVVALLMKRHGFEARAALAWVRLANPVAPPPPIAFSPVAEPPTASDDPVSCN
jgi:hypothetical protein